MLSFNEFNNMKFSNIEELMSLLNSRGYKTKKVSGKRCVIMYDAGQDRIKILTSLAKELGGKYETSKMSTSSAGIVELPGNFSFFTKPDGKQRTGAAGINNEMRLLNTINDVCKDFAPIDIEFKAGNKKLLCKNVIKAESVGTIAKEKFPDEKETQKNIPKKADVVLHLKDGKKIPISLKQSNAEKWESCDNFGSPIVKPVLDKLLANGTVKLTEVPGKNAYKVFPNFAIKATTEEAKRFVFGSDLLRDNGAVVVKTFFNNVLELDENGTYVCKVDEIITSMSDIASEDYPLIFVRNSIDRKNKVLGYNGLRVEAVKRSRISKQVITVNRNTGKII